MELFAADGHDAGGCERVTGKSGMRPHKLYHLGVRAFVSRSSLARVNAQQPYTLYEALFGRLLARCQQRAPRHGFRFKNKLFAVDASTIDLCLAAFPWASFRRTKGAIKLHVGVDQAGHLPTFISVTDGKTGDVTVARTWTFPAGSVVVADRAYLDFGWLHQLQQRGVTFVTRLKRNVRYQVVREHDVDIRTGVLSDQTIELTSARSRKAYPGTLRRVGYWDEERSEELGEHRRLRRANRLAGHGTGGVPARRHPESGIAGTETPTPAPSHGARLPLTPVLQKEENAYMRSTKRRSGGSRPVRPVCSALPARSSGSASRSCCSATSTQLHLRTAPSQLAPAAQQLVDPLAHRPARAGQDGGPHLRAAVPQPQSMRWLHLSVVQRRRRHDAPVRR